MGDYKVIIRIKNNRLLKAMHDCGFKTAASLSRAADVNQNIIGSYLNLTDTPWSKVENRWKIPILKISKILGRLPEDLFPEGHIKKALKINTISYDVDQKTMLQLAHTQHDPCKLLENIEAKGNIRKILCTLTPREEAVVRLRYGFDDKEKTYKAIAEIIGVTRERVRQIEFHALRKLRHPSRENLYI